MNNSNDFSKIRFDRPRIPRRLLPVIIAAILFILIWRLASPGAVFWLGLIMTAILVWVASYGWRTALMALIDFLHYLGTR
jgi:hypothetical protein